MHTHTLATLPTGESPEFDTVYRLDAHGSIVPTHRSDYLPTVEHDDAHDVTVDGIPRRELDADDWQPLTGITGQYGYSGAVMHPSELWSPAHVEALARLIDADDTPTADDMPADGSPSIAVSAVEFAVVECLTDDDDDPGMYADTPIGWVVLYRPLHYRAHTFTAARDTGATSCERCHLMPLDADDTATACPGYAR